MNEMIIATTDPVRARTGDADLIAVNETTSSDADEPGTTT